MIAYLAGNIVGKDNKQLVLLTSGGVGYAVGVTKMQLASYSVGQEVSFYTYMKVSDSALALYGFETVEARQFFELLLSVSGVGPKSAMNILALGSIEDISAAIGRGDVKYLTAVQGMGKKTAERMVVELKSRITSHVSHSNTSPQSALLVDVVEGLVAMGYGKEEAKAVVREMDAGEKTVEELLREALRNLRHKA